ncbi:Hpt domain-containing protein [Sulfurimonas lithotrophica]|uniref:Hpt domain-containing protein n=1 Tax=Sulfurimonas lithotrophica TaxID=2590022 RepID=A0A5P8NY77_9BACT|nr:Hpt domain-containing protein [Sulfurimonas lithotrophica]QFR48367.1 Hpt domain-containing protein [Sulfurimonas lithotrophica]
MPIVHADYSNLDHEEMAASIGLSAKHVPILIASYLEEADGGLAKLEESINKRDYAAIKADAHFIKGSSGNLKFNELYEMSKEMEFAGAEADESFDYEGYLKAIKEAISTIK